MRKNLAALPLILAAFLILIVSVVRTASVKYVFSQEPSPLPENEKPLNIDYTLPKPSLTPENPLWPVQALIDMGEDSPQAFLENADIRLVAGEQMFSSGKIEEGVLVLEKAELYLNQSYSAAIAMAGSEEKEAFLEKLALASLKHREVLETILVRAPEDGRATVATILDTPKVVYENSAKVLIESGLEVPEYPF